MHTEHFEMLRRQLLARRLPRITPEEGVKLARLEEAPSLRFEAMCDEARAMLNADEKVSIDFLLRHGGSPFLGKMIREAVNETAPGGAPSRYVHTRQSSGPRPITQRVVIGKKLQRKFRPTSRRSI